MFLGGRLWYTHFTYEEIKSWKWLDALLKVTQLTCGRNSTLNQDLDFWSRVFFMTPELLVHSILPSSQPSYLCCHHIVFLTSVVESMENNHMVSLGEKNKGFLAILTLWCFLFLEQCSWTNFCFFPSCLETSSCCHWNWDQCGCSFSAWNVNQLCYNPKPSQTLAQVSVCPCVFLSCERIVVLEVLGGNGETYNP